MAPLPNGRLALKGLCPITAVPFRADGSVDFDSFSSLLAYLSTLNLKGLVLFGIASEFHKLDDQEKDRLARIFTAHLAESKILSFISVTEHATEIAVKRAVFYESLGADGLMLLPPHFLAPDKKAILDHVHEVSRSVSLPIMFQYAPNETGFFLSRNEFKDLAAGNPGLLFKIESNPPMEDIKMLLQVAPNASVLNGYAGLHMMSTLDLGAGGVMPGCSFLEIYVEILRLYDQGDKTGALSLHDRLRLCLERWMSHCEYIIAVEKHILCERGIIKTDYCRRPAWSLTSEDKKDVERFLSEFELVGTKY